MHPLLVAVAMAVAAAPAGAVETLNGFDLSFALLARDQILSEVRRATASRL